MIEIMILDVPILCTYQEQINRIIPKNCVLYIYQKVQNYIIIVKNHFIFINIY